MWRTWRSLGDFRIHRYIGGYAIPLRCFRRGRRDQKNVGLPYVGIVGTEPHPERSESELTSKAGFRRSLSTGQRWYAPDGGPALVIYLRGRASASDMNSCLPSTTRLHSLLMSKNTKADRMDHSFLLTGSGLRNSDGRV